MNKLTKSILCLALFCASTQVNANPDSYAKIFVDILKTSTHEHASRYLAGVSQCDLKPYPVYIVCLNALFVLVKREIVDLVSVQEFCVDHREVLTGSPKFMSELQDLFKTKYAISLEEDGFSSGSDTDFSGTTSTGDFESVGSEDEELKKILAESILTAKREEEARRLKQQIEKDAHVEESAVSGVVVKESVASQLLSRFAGRISSKQILDGRAVLIQLPVVAQGGGECGVNAIYNSEAFAMAEEAGILIDSLTGPKATCGVSEKRKLVQNRCGKSSDLDTIELMDAFQSGNAVCKFRLSTGEIVRRAVIAGSESGRLDDYEITDAVRRFKSRRLSVSEVFALNTGGHWIAVRVEKMENGMIAVLQAESSMLNPSGSSISNEAILTELARMFLS